MPIDCPAIVVVDGDSLRCGSERLRLLGIDAPELHGCPSWRICVEGDGNAARESLEAGVRMGPFRFNRVGTDRFGRSLVVAWAGQTNLACWQLERGKAVYKDRWDTGGIVGRACLIPEKK